MIFDARKVSRRWTTVTLLANFVRNTASSIAESPPPTTAISCPRKKYPSQVAQVDTPWPISVRSDGRPSSFADAPVAMMTAPAWYSASVVATTNGRLLKSTRTTLPWMISAPNFSVCARISPMRSGPMMPSRWPGKFSTSVVSMS